MALENVFYFNNDQYIVKDVRFVIGKNTPHSLEVDLIQSKIYGDFGRTTISTTTEEDYEDLCGQRHDLLIQDLTIKFDSPLCKQLDDIDNLFKLSNECKNTDIIIKKEEQIEKFMQSLKVFLIEYALYETYFYPTRSGQFEHHEMVVNKSFLVRDIQRARRSDDSETIIAITDIIPVAQDKFNVISETASLVSRPEEMLVSDIRGLFFQLVTEQSDLEKLVEHVDEALSGLSNKDKDMKSLSF